MHLFTWLESRNCHIPAISTVTGLCDSSVNQNYYSLYLSELLHCKTGLARYLSGSPESLLRVLRVMSLVTFQNSRVSCAEPAAVSEVLLTPCLFVYMCHMMRGIEICYYIVNDEPLLSQYSWASCDCNSCKSINYLQLITNLSWYTCTQLIIEQNTFMYNLHVWWLAQMNYYINQPVNKSINQPSNRPTNQSINQSINKSINQPTIQPINQLINRQ